MNLKLVACDMDGTLLNSKNEISEKHAKVAELCAEKGIAFTVCSGRAFVSIKPYLKSLRSDKGFMIGYNGGRIATMDMKTEIYRCPMTARDVRSIIDLGMKLDATTIVWADEVLYVNRINDSSIAYAKLSSAEAVLFDPENPVFLQNLADNDITTVDKVFWTDPPEKTDYLEKNARPLVPETVQFMRSGSIFLEFVDAKVSKGDALRRLCDYLGVDISESAAFGDAENDLAMLEAAGRAVAMGNASDVVKESADTITETNDNDGVYNEFMRIIGE